MRGWGLRERLDLLFDNGDSDNDLDSDEAEELRSGWVEHLVNAIAKVLGWPKRKRHFSGDWLENDDG